MSKLYGWAVIVICCFLTITTTVNGEPTYDLHGDLIYPGAEEFSGVIDGFEANGERRDIIVINDSIYTIQSDAIFRNRAGGKTGLSSFQPGMIVKFYALDNLLTKMWETEEDEEGIMIEDPEVSPEQPARGDQVRQEDGVWTN